jgi:GNAT superfamily N-acetyltransferase
MKIRRAKLEDIDSIIPVFLDYEESSMKYLAKKYKAMRDKKNPLLKHIKKALEEDIVKKNGRYLIMEHEKRIIGYIFGEIREDKHPLFKRPKTGEFSDIAVKKEYQGQGISSLLYKELEEWFIKRKCEMITLNVNINNDAKKIYERWGYEPYYLRMIKKL